jgi:hypothetical protein
MSSHRHLMRAWTIALALALLAGLGGCAALNPFAGRPAPDTPEEALGYTYATITGVARATTDALQRGRITVEQAEGVLEELDRADAIADEAKALMAAGDIIHAQDRLALAGQLLAALERWLAKEVADG